MRVGEQKINVTAYHGTLAFEEVKELADYKKNEKKGD